MKFTKKQREFILKVVNIERQKAFLEGKIYANTSIRDCAMDSIKNGYTGITCHALVEVHTKNIDLLNKELIKLNSQTS